MLKSFNITMKKHLLSILLYLFPLCVIAQTEDYIPVNIPENGGMFAARGRAVFMNMKDPSMPSRTEMLNETSCLVFEIIDTSSIFRMSIFTMSDDMKKTEQMIINPYLILDIYQNRVLVKPLYLSLADSTCTKYEEAYSLYKNDDNCFFLKREIQGLDYVEIYAGQWADKGQPFSGLNTSKQESTADYTDEIKEPSIIRGVDPFEPGWGVGEEFRPTTNFVGSYWEPTMRIVYYPDRYILSIIRPATDDYFKIYEGDDCYFKLDTGEIIELPLLTEFGVWNYYQKGYYSGNTYMQGRYITQMFYEIPDISILSKHNIVKIRYFVNHQPRDINIESEGNINRFNKNIKASAVQAQHAYNIRQTYEENPIKGF